MVLFPAPGQNLAQQAVFHTLLRSMPGIFANGILLGGIFGLIFRFLPLGIFILWGGFFVFAVTAIVLEVCQGNVEEFLCSQVPVLIIRVENTALAGTEVATEGDVLEIRPYKGLVQILLAGCVGAILHTQVMDRGQGFQFWLRFGMFLSNYQTKSLLSSICY